MDYELRAFMLLVLKGEVKFESDNEFSYEKFLHLLINHRIFLNFYDIIKPFLPKPYLIKYQLIYEQLLNEKKQFYSFAENIIKFINQSKVPYVVLKGFADELIIYNKLNTRMYGDLDILVDEENFDDFLNYIKNFNEKVKIDRKNDYYEHEVRVYIDWNGKNYLLEVKKRHRELEFNQTKLYTTKCENIELNEINIPVLNKNMLFCSKCVYLYNYIERIAGWLMSKKIRFCYFYDFKNLILNNYDKYDFSEIISILKEQRILHKALLIIKHLSDLFEDDRLNELYIKLLNEKIDYQCDGYYSYGKIKWPFSIQNRIFNYDQISLIIKNYLYGNFYLNKTNLLTYENAKKTLINKTTDDRLLYEIIQSDKNIIFKFDLKNFKNTNDSVIYIRLFHKDKIGLYVEPFSPVSVRFSNNEIYVFNRFTINTSDYVYEFEKEKLLSYQKKEAIKVIKDDNILQLIINKNDLGISTNKNHMICYDIELISIYDVDKIYIEDRISDVSDRPVILYENNFDIDI